MGMRDQVLHHAIRPVVTPAEPIAGPAFTIDAVKDGRLLDDPYAQEIAAVDAIPGGAFVVVGTAGTVEAAVWGELLATVAGNRGAVAAVTDGAVRDLAGLRRKGLPTYAAAVSARDSYGRLLVVGFGGETTCGGVATRPGDLVLADEDGVVVVPRDRAEEAIAAAEAKLQVEDVALVALESGTSLQDMYDEHGVL